MNKKISQLAVAALFSLAAVSANANNTVTYNGFNYLLNVQRMTYTGNEAEIQSTPWWGNESLALALANIYKPSEAITDSVRFAYAQTTGASFENYIDNKVTTKSYFGDWGTYHSSVRKSVNGYYVFGTATAAVPEADTSAMLLMGAGVMGFMARRRKQVAA